MRFWLDATPVILAEVGVIHEQRPVHIWQRALVDVLLYDVVHSPIEVLVGLVDCVVVEGERVREVQLYENVVRVRWDVEEVL